jgi:hypothetical protein
MLITCSRIFQIPKLGTKLKEDILPLSYTPRKLIQHPANRFMYLIEGDHRTWSEEAVQQKVAELVCFLLVRVGICPDRGDSEQLGRTTRRTY